MSDFGGPLTGRILHAQVSLNSQFHKQYRNEHPVLEPLFASLTLGQAYHLVRVVSNIESYYVILNNLYTVIFRYW